MNDGRKTPPSAQSPLLRSDGASSINSDERAGEEDALLTGQPRRHGRIYDWTFWREVGLFVWATLATAAVIILAVLYQRESASPTGFPTGKRNLIFMVSDGKSYHDHRWFNCHLDLLADT
jgi:alkaline phosphatase